jgi:hypothetical protein
VSNIITRVFDYLGSGGWTTEKIEVGNGGSQPVEPKGGDLTTDQLPTLFSNPVEVGPAQGAGKAICIVAAFFRGIPGSG